MEEIVPFNLLSRHVAPLRAEFARITEAFLDSGHYVLGPNVSAFEQAFAAYVGVDHGVGVGNGTDALEIALKAVGVVPGDPVALVANAAMYGTTGVLAAGGEPVYVDVESETATMDPRCFAEALSTHPTMKAVIVTHLYGQLARIDEIVGIARDAGVRVIEDCAQAHGARIRDGRQAGSFGDAGCFSFYPTKNLGALGDGGAVVSNDAVIADRVRKLRQYGWTSKYANGLPGGRNSRLDELQAAFLRVMLPLLDGWNVRRRDIANRLSRGIVNPRIRTPGIVGEDHVGHLYVVRSDSRDALRQHLQSLGIQTDVHYPNPDHRQACHHGRFDQVRLPVTEREADTVLSLPCFPELADDEVARIVSACNSF